MISREHAEHVAVEVDRVMPCRLVHELDAVRMPAAQRENRRAVVLVLGERLAVHGPEESLVLALARQRPHHAAAECDAMALGLGKVGDRQRIGREPRQRLERRAQRLVRGVLELENLVGALRIEVVDHAVAAARLAGAVDNQIRAHARPEHHALIQVRHRLAVEREDAWRVTLEERRVNPRVGGVDESQA